MSFFKNPPPSFEDPLGLLRACHDRILHHCETLERLAHHLEHAGANAEARQTAARIRRYFQVSGPAHHADEEEQLFPWLLAQTGFPDSLRTILQELAAEHRELDQMWQALDMELAQVEHGTAVNLHPDPFVSMSRIHIARENGRIFPEAEKLLAPETRMVLGAEMEKRRRQD